MVERMDRVDPMDMSFVNLAKKKLSFGDVVYKIAVRNKLIGWWKNTKADFAVVQTNKEKSGHHAPTQMYFFRGKMSTLFLYTYIFPRGESDLKTLYAVAGGPLMNDMSSAFDNSGSASNSGSDCEDKGVDVTSTGRTESHRNKIKQAERDAAENRKKELDTSNDAASETFLKSVQMFVKNDTLLHSKQDLGVISKEIMDLKRDLRDASDDPELIELIERAITKCKAEMKNIMFN
ncbi:hypothetical protein SARC_11080 [Sphaeroforma arctica JP610]|uniref:Uncharacterized protein n=1 Tax=Sphaeroforma arctica JP610 TaxID=667725 RepID=A0A0L0FI03_9EUKA|nr:hypothetical protein SARC_11080 [Sphaeroforma arctica JP610]KNC76419.1 hypothetical protein SARC_11080 [Sphaeroforma arctica JP610]|eukprot:XP_014150321.1 hypothetical protein SARC_11080 [Sphaeroforma arctica JP610]